MKPMSNIQKKVYNYILEYVTQNLFAPSIREICKAVGLKSTSSVYTHLNSLEARGYIKCFKGGPRRIQLCGYKLMKDSDAVCPFSTTEKGEEKRAERNSKNHDKT